MIHFTLANPGFVPIFEEGWTMESFDYVGVFGFNLVGKNRILHTAEFRPDGMELEELTTIDWVSWGVPVPKDALVFGATSGISPGLSKQFWVGWLDGRRLHMQALMQVKPIDTELSADEIPIFPAITDYSGVANLYTWRPAGAATALWRRSFIGQIKTAGTMTNQALSEIPGHPMVSVAGGIPGERAQNAVIGWVENTAEGAVLGMAIVMPDRFRTIRSEPIRGMKHFPRQRPALWFSGEHGTETRFQFSGVLETQAGPPTYSVAVFDVGSDSNHGTVSLTDVEIKAGELHAAAFDYEKNIGSDSLLSVYLTKDGSLWANHPFEIKRRGVDLDSPLPMVAIGYKYWGTRAADGTMTFASF